jgi:hypothetical protein
MPAPMIIATPLAVTCGRLKTRSKFSLPSNVRLCEDESSIAKA